MEEPGQIWSDFHILETLLPGERVQITTAILIYPSAVDAAIKPRITA